jgi:O-Antigen ligase
MSSVALSQPVVKYVARKAGQNNWLIYLLVVSPVLFRATRYFISIATGGRAEPLSIIEIALLLACFYQVYVRWLFQRKPLFELCKADLYVFLFVGAAGLSIVALLYEPVDHSESIKAFVRLMEYVALYLIISSNTRSWEAVKKLLIFLVGCGVAVSLFAVIQYRMGPLATTYRFPWGTWWNAYQYASSFRAYSFFFNPLYVGGFLSIVWPINLGLLMGERGSKARSFYLAALLVNCGGMLITFSRSAVVALGVALFVFAKARARFAIAGGFLALIIGSFLIPRELRVRLFLQDEESRENAFARLGRYEEGLTLFAHHPIFGVGYGNYQAHFTGGSSGRGDVGYEPATGTFVEEYVRVREDYRYTAENLVIQDAGEMGTFGLIAVLALYVHFLAFLWKLRKKSASSEGWVVGLFTGLLSFLACSMFATLTAVEMNSALWVLLGISKAVWLRRPRPEAEMRPLGRFQTL